MSKNKKNKKISTLSTDTIAEDLFGLNIRGMRSIGVLWANPRRYFEAARTPDWNGNYTPSIRLWLSFFALFSALKFWWIGGNDSMIRAYAAGFAQAGLQTPEGLTYEDIGTEAVLWVFGLVPFLQIISMVLLAMIFPFWGERTNLALKQRYLFGVIVPSASLMPIIMTIMMFVPSHMLEIYAMMLAVIAFVLDFQTGYRGGFEKVSGIHRAWRAGLLALIVMILNVGTSIAAQIAGIIRISQKYGVAPPG